VRPGSSRLFWLITYSMAVSADFNFRAVVLLAASCLTCGCSSDPPPPVLTPALARNVIAQKWEQGELNYYRVTFHSDSLIPCGVQNGLWMLDEVKDASGNAWSMAYRLTEKGSRIVHSIDLKESGKGHQMVLRGPYQAVINSITDGAQPTSKQVAFQWLIDWGKASEDLKACLPRFELTGAEVAQFDLIDNSTWTFAAYVTQAGIPSPH
jgi:hypothetical protein